VAASVDELYIWTSKNQTQPKVINQLVCPSAITIHKGIMAVGNLNGLITVYNLPEGNVIRNLNIIDINPNVTRGLLTQMKSKVNVLYMTRGLLFAAFEEGTKKTERDSRILFFFLAENLFVGHVVILDIDLGDQEDALKSVELKNVSISTIQRGQKEIYMLCKKKTEDKSEEIYTWDLKLKLLRKKLVSYKLAHDSSKSVSK